MRKFKFLRKDRADNGVEEQRRCIKCGRPIPSDSKYDRCLECRRKKAGHLRNAFGTVLACVVAVFGPLRKPLSLLLDKVLRKR